MAITITALTTMMPISSGASRPVTASCARRPKPGMAKCFDHDAAAKHGSRLQTEHGNERQKRVSRHMAQDNPVAGKAL